MMRDFGFIFGREEGGKYIKGNEAKEVKSLLTDFISSHIDGLLGVLTFYGQ